MLFVIFSSAVLFSATRGPLSPTANGAFVSTRTMVEITTTRVLVPITSTLTVTSTATAPVTTTTTTTTRTATEPLLTATPSTGTVSSAVTISGSGLLPVTDYVVSLSNNPKVGGATGLTQFTSDPGGGVPAGVIVVIRDTPTAFEPGTQMYLQVQTLLLSGPTNPPAATAPFVLAASASLNTTGAFAGQLVTISAHGLNPSATYWVIFGYVRSPLSPTSYAGANVANVSLISQTGAGSATFRVPANFPAGPTQVQLIVATKGANPLGADRGNGILNPSPTMTVLG